MKARRFAISDIHGRLQTFRALLTQIGFCHDDCLFLLGDYIDRGPDSIGTLNFLIDLQQANPKLKIIRGSHEELFLLFYYNRDVYMVKKMIARKKYSFQHFEHLIEQKHLDFIEQMPYYIELDDCILVHAGLDLEAEKPFEETEDMLWIKDWQYLPGKLNNKSIIHGHQSQSLIDIKKMIDNREKKICIDNCCNSTEPEFGNLLCLNLDSYELTIQRNID